MSRQSRIDSYKRGDGPCGAARDKANLRSWSDRAERYSTGADHRASDGKMILPNTGDMTIHDTNEGRAGDQRAAAKADKNFSGDSPFMKSVRRNA